MKEPLTTPGVRATVQRAVTDEETVAFEGFYNTSAEAESAVASQLELCRLHMIAYNERVRAVDVAKKDELDAAIAEKGAELKQLQADLAEARLALTKLDKKTGTVRAVG